MHHSHLIEICGKSYRLHESGVSARLRKAGTRAGAVRRSELVRLDVDDVGFKTAGIVLRLRRSKTNQESELE